MSIADIKGNNSNFRISALTLDDLARLGKLLADLFCAGDILFLQGDLGVGKTTFTQFVAEALDVSDDQYVSSPSFALLHEYSGRLPVYHMDFYRLHDEDDIEGAGLLDYLDRKGVCIIEWPDRLGSLMPDERLELSLQIASDDTRDIILKPHGKSWIRRTAQLKIACKVLQQQKSR